MEDNFIRIDKWLLPLSCIYGLGVKLRNMMFESGLLKSRTFDIPVISVGNITVGGTGKTPHVEYLIRLLKNQCHVAVLSRGYKRKTKGFVLADDNCTVEDIGDEPYQIKQKFHDITVAVDKNRCHGIDALQQSQHKPDVVLLDDAFQHRYVKPGVNILLVDYHRLISHDCMLPAGRLREPMEEKRRADIVIITKCPKDMMPMEYRAIMKDIDIRAYQQLFFTTIEYGELQPLFKAGNQRGLQELNDHNVLILSGIGSPKQLTQDLSPYSNHITPLAFSDHHHFSQRDIQLINDTFAVIKAPKCIVTTEKDATRLKCIEGLSDEVRNSCYALPITVRFMQEQEDTFNQFIFDYVRKNSRNSILAQGKDDEQPKDCNCAGNRPRTISFRNN